MFYLSCGLVCLLSGCTVVKTNYSGQFNQTNHNLVYYYLPESVLSITTTVKGNGYYDKNDSLVFATILDREYAITTETIADTKNMLVLEYAKNGFFSDNVEFQVNAKGLLTNANATTEDKTASIIDDIGKALAEVAKPLGGKAATPLTVLPIEYTRTHFIKAADLTNAGKVIRWNIEVKNSKNPQKASFLLDESCQISTPEANTAVFDMNLVQSDDAKSKTVNGILTRPIRNLNVHIKPRQDTSYTASSYVRVIDVSKLLVLPIKRTAFTKTINTMTIADGVVTSNKIDRESPVKGFVSIPINVAKAIVSIPAQLVQIRINTAKSDKELLDKEKERLNAELQYRTELQKIKAKLDSLNKKP